MNAGRDVERLIAGWLKEEAPGRAPDRLLESTADVIDRTKQRRFGAAWRNPVTMNLRTLVAAAAVIVVLVAGAAWIGRQSATGGVTQSAAPTASASGTAPATDSLSQMQAYRSAFAAVCASLASIPDPDPSATPSEFVAFLQTTIARENQEVAGLEAIEAPGVVQAEHLANIQTLKDVIALLNHMIDLYQANPPKTAEAAAVDEATGSLNTLREDFAAKYGLSTRCP